MLSFTIPVFMNALSTVLLFSLVDNARSAAIAAQPGYLPHHPHHPHQHNHIRPVHININDLKINHQKHKNGHPSMPSVSSQIFSEEKLEDNVLLVNDAYLMDGWQNSGEVANHNAEADDGSGSPSLRLADAHGDGNSVNTATIKTIITGPQPHHTQAEGRIDAPVSEVYQDATEYYHTQPRPKMSMTALEPVSAGVPHMMESGTLSRSRVPAPGLSHHQACKTILRESQSGLGSRLSSFANSIHRGLISFINFRLSMYGVELRRTESPSGEGEYNMVFENFIWE